MKLDRKRDKPHTQTAEPEDKIEGEDAEFVAASGDEGPEAEQGEVSSVGVVRTLPTFDTPQLDEKSRKKAKKEQDSVVSRVSKIRARSGSFTLDEQELGDLDEERANGAGSSGSKKQETPEDQCRRWKASLPLEKTLGGAKLGVLYRRSRQLPSCP